MTREIPTPLRAVAGLAAFAVDEARRLPSRLSALPVVAVGAAMQASMKVQQRYAELVGRGDELLSGMSRTEEQPPWARFDEDQQTTTAAGRLANAQSWAFDAGEIIEEEIGEVAEDTSEYEDYLPGSPNGATSTERADLGDTDPGDSADLTAEEGPPLASYDRLSLPQLRARLRVLSADDLRVLIRYEQEHQARPPFLTMLENRLTALTGN